MRDTDTWLTTNDQYLAESMAWLRARLARHAPSPEPQRRGLIERWCYPEPRVETELPPQPVVAEHVDNPPALEQLARRFRLSDFERNVLLLCVAMELDTGIAAMCARAQGDAAMAWPTFALAFTLFDQPAWDAMGAGRPLRRWQLIGMAQGDTPRMTAAALHADERIVNYVKGLNRLDDRLAAMLVADADTDVVLPPSHAELAAAIVRDLSLADPVRPVVQLLGADQASKRVLVRHIADGLRVQRLDADALSAPGFDIDTLARLWQREAALLPIALFIDASEVDRGSAQAIAVRRFLQLTTCPVFLDVREAWRGIDRMWLQYDVAKPQVGEQRDAWLRELGATETVQADRLSSHFNFDLPSIARIGALAASRPDTLWEHCINHARPALDQLAQRIEPRASWDDLKLPASDMALLRQIGEQVAGRSAVYDSFGFRNRMNRGLGISVLFAGESGTGKTMAAEVLANELSMLLYRIDLSAVVSKYIGETEKNLRRLFDAAEQGGSILLFDEADALFGKRSEVKDSHDRYANIEINYLLQRIEAYQGLAILATNMKSALDAAFMRRLRFVVNFPMPGQAERKAMWQSAFPPQTPCRELDADMLARLPLNGGNIHSIALNCAFLAAARGAPVDMPMLLDAARAEMRKLDKPVNESDFRLPAGEAQ